MGGSEGWEGFLREQEIYNNKLIEECCHGRACGSLRVQVSTDGGEVLEIEGGGTQFGDLGVISG